MCSRVLELRKLMNSLTQRAKALRQRLDEYQSGILDVCNHLRWRLLVQKDDLHNGYKLVALRVLTQRHK